MTDPLHIALSKVLYPTSKVHPVKDTSAMLLDVELLHECSECDGRCAVRMCEKHDPRPALRDCAVHEVNTDTCGVCGRHFAECEADERCVGDEVDEHDIPTGREPACPGARARALLATST